ncbi:MAG: hypothetical protein OES99_08290, partial [Gammaproteobacteria bacterium]|nr:hypothetical protein [Gammaproteobacteria bacterium]
SASGLFVDGGNMNQQIPVQQRVLLSAILMRDDLAMRNLTLVLISVALGSCAGEATDFARLSRVGPQGIAIDGYSPVSYFSEGRAEQGSSDYAVSHDGVTYWLTDAEQVLAFNADPRRYQPAHGGWCSLMLTGSGQLTPANPESFKIVDDRLLLFWSGDFQGMAIDGSRNWHSKFEDSAGEMALLAKADAAWTRLLAGTVRQKIVLFNESDGDRINETRRAVAKKQYE